MPRVALRYPHTHNALYRIASHSSASVHVGHRPCSDTSFASAARRTTYISINVPPSYLRTITTSNKGSSLIRKYNALLSSCQVGASRIRASASSDSKPAHSREMPAVAGPFTWFPIGKAESRRKRQFRFLVRSSTETVQLHSSVLHVFLGVCASPIVVLLSVKSRPHRLEPRRYHGLRSEGLSSERVSCRLTRRFSLGSPYIFNPAYVAEILCLGDCLAQPDSADEPLILHPRALRLSRQCNEVRHIDLLTAVLCLTDRSPFQVRVSYMSIPTFDRMYNARDARGVCAECAREAAAELNLRSTALCNQNLHAAHL